MNAGPWFVAPPGEWREDTITLPAEESHHALHVLRVTPPDVVTVVDGAGTVARCAASAERDGRLVVEILEREQRPAPRPELVVYQGAAKGHKLDGAVERLAELGVSGLWAFESRRAVARWDADKVARLDERWASIARSAAKVSRSPFVMDTGAGLSFTELVRRVAAEPLAVVLWEEATLPLRTALVEGAARVALVVGPEGGLERVEAEQLADSGAQLASLGPRILRTETAPVAAAAAILYHYNLLG